MVKWLLKGEKVDLVPLPGVKEEVGKGETRDLFLKVETSLDAIITVIPFALLLEAGEKLP